MNAHACLKTLSVPLGLLMLLTLCPPMAHAGDGGNQESNVALVELASKSMAATLRLEDGLGPAETQPHYGVFVSDDGLALIDLNAIRSKRKPKVVAADGTVLELGKILRVFPGSSLAVVKFAHRPKAWLKIAEQEPEPGEVIAVMINDDPTGIPSHEQVTPLVGPILAKRSMKTSSLRRNTFQRVLSLGAGLTRSQRVSLAVGDFAINREGDLVGSFFSQHHFGDQVLLLLCPLAPLADIVQAVAAGGEAIPFPLPDADNPYDPVALDSKYVEMGRMTVMGKLDERRRLLKELLRKYPDSLVVKDAALATLGNPEGQKRLVGLKDFPEPDPADSVAQQVLQWTARAFLLEKEERVNEAIQARQKAIALGPKDDAEALFALANLYLRHGRYAEAEMLMRDAYPAFSDCLNFVRDFEKVLIWRGHWRDADRMTERMDELEAIYRRR